VTIDNQCEVKLDVIAFGEAVRFVQLPGDIKCCEDLSKFEGNNRKVIPKITFILNSVGERERTSQSIGNSRIQISESGIALKLGEEFSVFVVNRTGGLDIYVDYAPSVKRQLLLKAPKFIQKMKSSEFETASDAISRSFMFRVYYPLLTLFLRSQDKVLMHGSTLCVGDETHLYTGLGGSGKTSLSSYTLLNNATSKFIADDISVIDANTRQVYFNPFVVHVYPYNVKGFDKLFSRISSNWKFLEKLHWYTREKLFGVKGVRRRVSPNLLFEVNSADTYLSNVEFCFRTTETLFNRRVISSAEISDVSVEIILDEVKGLATLLNDVGCIPKEIRGRYLKDNLNIFNISLNEFLNSYQRLLNNIFRKTLNHVLFIPNKTNPEELYSLVQKDRQR